MATLIRSLVHSSRRIVPVTATPLGNGLDSLTSKLQRLSLICMTNNRLGSSSTKNNMPDLPHLPNDGPYPKYEATPSPYKPPIWRRHGYNPEFYQGGKFFIAFIYSYSCQFYFLLCLDWFANAGQRNEFMNYFLNFLILLIFNDHKFVFIKLIIN